MNGRIFHVYEKLCNLELSNTERIHIMYELIVLSYKTTKKERIELSELGSDLKKRKIPNFRDLVFLYGAGLQLLAYHEKGIDGVDEFII